MSKDNKANKPKDKIEEVEEKLVEDSKVSEKEEDTKKEPTQEEVLAQEKDRYLRLFAEFENYKKRTAKERIELFRTANRELMTVLLPVLDDFDRGLNELKKEKETEALKGMKLINEKFRSALKQQGLVQMKVKSGDVFDAEIHQAITQIPAPKKKLIGKIIDTVEQGYMLGDVIIRFPKVVVGK